MILVHGGFWRGCRSELDEVAWEAAGNVYKHLSHNYIALTIDFRLPCDPTDPNLQGSPILALCGWSYPTIDNDGSGKAGAGIHDVQSAVHWVTSTWQYLSGRRQWNHKIVILGTSGGGLLAYSAVAPSPTTVGGSVAADVDKVASWSGALKLDLMSNGQYACNYGQTSDPNECAQGASRYYLGCNPIAYPDSACVQNGRYRDASASTWYTNTTFPHAFIANAGGPDPTYPPELQSLQAMLDFEQTLTNMQWVNGNQYVKCIVSTPPPAPHGRALRGWKCDGDATRTVWMQTADFLG